MASNRTRLSASNEFRVEFEGLRDFRRDLNKADKEAGKQMRLVLKEATEVVAKEAQKRSPRKSGTLAKSIKPGTSGDRALIRSSLDYFAVHEFGGTVGRGRIPGRAGSGSIKIKKSSMVYGAISSKRLEAERIVLKGIDRLGRIAGFDD